uniref:DUF3782 domain-containing protein n=1 Tax=uncultured bacterium contig00068 TaxID=1181549 RepID=A0A806K1H8_9BACT|nr:hypothetical protein [uncultured bacterium contig00068]
MEAVQTSNTPAADEIWAILKENAIGMKELRKSQEETARQMEEYNKRIGHLDNLFGEVSEYMVAPRLYEKFRELGYNFPKVNPKGAYINDRDNQIFLEIDLMLENGDKAILVEVKTKITTERVNKHIERLEKMRKYADLHGDKRKFLGAIAGIVANDEVKNLVLKQGFYLIEPSGDSFTIIQPDGKPKEW